MPRPYSTDLRERALRACERGRVTRARIAALFGVGETTLYRWQQQTRIDGRRKAKPARGGPAPRLASKSLDELRALVAEANALTLAAYAGRLAERTGVRVSGSTLCRALHRPVGSADIPPGDRAKPDGLVRKKPFEPRSETRTYGDFVPFTPWGLQYVLVNDPEAIREVLVTKTDSVHEESGAAQREGRRSARVCSPARAISTAGSGGCRSRRFIPQRVAAYADAMVRFADEMAAGWRDGQEDGRCTSR